jgi:replication fork protection complex subunit Tof1/Swi1
VVKPVENSQKIALFKNGLLRLLLNLIGFQRVSELDDPNTSWIIPSALSADQLKQSLDLINKFEFSPPVFDDGKEAGDLIRRKSAGTAARRAAFDDDDDDEDNGIDSDDESPLFPAGGPTTMKKPDALATLKKSRRRRRKEGSEDANGPTEEELNARAEARRRKELEKNRKIKSDLFVHDSDEDEDEERDRLFFQREEELRQKSKISIMKELLGVGKLKDDVKKGESKKRQSVAISVGMDEDSDEDDLLTTGSRKRQSSAVSVDSDEDDLDTPAATDHSSSLRKGDVVGSDGDSTDTPLSSPHNSFLQSKRRKLSGAAKPVSPTRSTTEKDIGEMMMIDGPDEEEDEIPIAPARRRVRAGFIIDSSDEE